MFRDGFKLWLIDAELSSKFNFSSDFAFETLGVSYSKYWFLATGDYFWVIYIKLVDFNDCLLDYITLNIGLLSEEGKFWY